MKKIVLCGITILFTLLFSVTDGLAQDKKTKTAGKKMQNFIIEISSHAKKDKPDFLVIPQNAPELAYDECLPSNSMNLRFMNAIDGFGIEELFFDGDSIFDNYRYKMLKEIVKTKAVLVSEVIDNPKNVENAIRKNSEEGFVCFPRSKENYHYSIIPEIHNENSQDISSIKDVQNYLYLINSKNFDSKKDFIDTINQTNFDLIIIDSYYLSFPFTDAEIESLKVKKNGGKRLVIAYMNIGAAENWRNYWKPEWKLGNPKWLKKPYEGYENEIFVEYWNPQWQKIILKDSDSYLQKIINANFDGVYLDNVEAFYTLYN